MHQKLRLLFAFLLLSGAAHAQQNMASETFKQRLRGQYLRNDTAQAIIALYSTRQAGGAGWVAAGILAAVRISIGASNTGNQGPYGSSAAPPNIGVVLLVASPVLAYGAGKIIHYSNAKLARTLTDYAAGKPLSRALRRKLKPRFFNQPIVEYQRVPVRAVPAQPAAAPVAAPAAAPPAAQKNAPVPSVIQAAPAAVPGIIQPGTDAPASSVPATPTTPTQLGK